MSPVVLRIHCLRCDTLLAIARLIDGRPVIDPRRVYRQERVTPPEAPEERWKWTCPNPECRRTRELRSKRIGDTLEAMRRAGIDGADI